MATFEPYGPWKIKSRAEVYQDSFIRLRCDQVIRPDNLDGQHVVVEMKPGVCVLPIDGNGNVYLTDEFHYGIGRHSIEAVSGGIEPGEDPDLTARRELQEELGLMANEWKYLTTVDPFTTIVVSPTRLYLATDLTAVEKNLDGTEQIQLVKMPLASAAEEVQSGKITHAPTCILILNAILRSMKKT